MKHPAAGTEMHSGQVLSDQLYDRVSIVLKSHGLGHFSDLCSAEQVTLLEEAHREIMSEDNKVGAAASLRRLARNACVPLGDTHPSYENKSSAGFRKLLLRALTFA